jgi:hypothetical protein
MVDSDDQQVTVFGCSNDGRFGMGSQAKDPYCLNFRDDCLADNIS